MCSMTAGSNERAQLCKLGSNTRIALFAVSAQRPRPPRMEPSTPRRMLRPMSLPI